jgi:hypothetical protein
MSLSKLNVSQLREILEDYGENPPNSWHKVELRARVVEIREQQGIPLRGGPPVTSLTHKLANLRKASRRKEELAKFCESLGMILTGNESVQTMQNKGIAWLYANTPATGEDPVSFGRHGDLTYQELRQEKSEYCTWVCKTAEESNSADPKLIRLAKWLKEEPTEPELTRSRPSASTNRGKGKGKDKPPTTTEVPNDFLLEMQKTIQDLKGQVEDLKNEKEAERPRKGPRDEN